MPILDETIQPLVGDIENDEENTESTGTFVERPHFALSQVTQCYSFSAKLSFLGILLFCLVSSHIPKWTTLTAVKKDASTVQSFESWPKWSDTEGAGDDEDAEDAGDAGDAYQGGDASDIQNAPAPNTRSNDAVEDMTWTEKEKYGYGDDQRESRSSPDEWSPDYDYGDDWGGGVGGWNDAKETTTTTTTTPHFLPVQPAITKYINHYDPANPLQIQAKQRRSDNYFLILGDWGKSGGPGSCQLAVATRMRQYVMEQRNAGKHLLFIASVGDNFYWTGATLDAWEKTWAEPYGVNDANSPLYQIPWMSLYGNHDFGNNDPHAFCPHLFPRKILHGQPYSSHQLNEDKFPGRPAYTAKYWLPDFNYHYELPDANLEVIVADTNGKVKPDLIGGDARGRAMADTNCSGQAVSQSFLQKLAESGDELVIQRAKKSTAGTVLLLQHYPGKCPRDIFENALPSWRKGKVRVLCAYGHDHTQACDKKDPATGLCIDILTGGGGGCCGPLVDLAGFTAVHLDDTGGVSSVEVENSSVRLPAGSCRW